MKKPIIIILIFIIVLTAVFFLLQRCEFREKSPEEEITETEKTEETEEPDERSAFINASIELTCKIYSDPALTEDEEKLKGEINKSYKKFGLPVENDEEMIAILDKYENDTEVLNIIKENSKSCQP